MARIRPFAAYRYARKGRDLTSFTAPPYDVISERQRAELLDRDPHNVVALELPDGPLDATLPSNRYTNGKATWDAWREAGVLEQDAQPCVYVLEQAYRAGEREIRRRAFIVEVELEPFEAGVVLPHERTLPKALGDRFELIKATGANLSQVFGLYDDAECASDALFEAVMSAEPIGTATDDDGVVSRLWASADADLASSLASLLDGRQVFIADGHHRYTTALAYRDLMREKAAVTGTLSTDAAYDFVMMALVNMDDPDLVVLPTHRVADANGTFDAAAFREGLARFFSVEPVGEGHPAGVLEALGRPGFLVKTADDGLFLAALRDDVDLDEAIPLPRSSAWKDLDVAVLQELILHPLLGIHPDEPTSLERLSFYKDAHSALNAVGEHDVAFVLRPTRMEQLRAVALAGETMPQKSTYFYPKLLSGLLMRAAE